jgi:thiamine-phosphate pyrophosphorylase
MRRARLLGRSPRFRNHRGRKPACPRLLFFTDPARTPDAAAIVARLPRGAGVVYRAFGAADALSAGKALRAVARRRHVVFMVGADAGLAAALQADGLHLPERLASRRGDNARWRRRFLLTAAAHGLPALRRARMAGVEAIVLSPVFPSRSPSAGRAIGPLAFRTLCRAAKVPVYALGGLNLRSARRLQQSGAAGIAGVDMFDMDGDRA